MAALLTLVCNFIFCSTYNHAVIHSFLTDLYLLHCKLQAGSWPLWNELCGPLPALMDSAQQLTAPTDRRKKGKERTFISLFHSVVHRGYNSPQVIVLMGISIAPALPGLKDYCLSVYTLDFRVPAPLCSPWILHYLGLLTPTQACISSSFIKLLNLLSAALLLDSILTT